MRKNYTRTLGIVIAALMTIGAAGPAPSDQGHAFEFLLGNWSVRYQKLARPLSGSRRWIRFGGPSHVRPLWDGKGNIEDGYFDLAGDHRAHLALRLYDAGAHRWNLYLGSSAEISGSPQAGAFDASGVGTFWGADTIGGKRVRVRQTWSRRDGHPHFEQALSADGGRTWETNWIADYLPDNLVRDGSHDFDFDLGVWRTHIRRLAHPFTAQGTWLEARGTVTVRSVWGGSGSVEELEADGSTHLELLNVRLYNAQSGQWSLNGASSADGTLADPMYGAFRHGEGTFFDQEIVDGRLALVRQRFFDITRTSYAFEQAVSDDGGAHWKPNFIARLDRVANVAPSEGTATAESGSHAFDFNYGTWSTHITTPAGAMTGTVQVRKIWNGRAFMEEIAAGNNAGSFEGLTLFLYDPKTRQWSQTYAGKGAGAFDPSAVGAFHDGTGELTAIPTPTGPVTLERDIWSNITADTHHFEIDYSKDGGATWTSEFAADLKRIGPGA